MTKIIRDDHLITAIVDGSNLKADQSFGSGYWTCFCKVLFPMFHEKYLIPQLYEKANKWADMVVSNHSKGSNQ